MYTHMHVHYVHATCNIQMPVEPLSVFYSGSNISNQSTVMANQQDGNITLRCLGHAPSGVRDLMWVSTPQGESEVVLRPTSNSNMSVFYGYNEAILTINNFIQPYRGTLRCQSLSSGLQVTIFVEESMLI